MPLIPWKPFSDLDKFFGDDDWIMPIFSRSELLKPAMDVYETDKEVIAETNIPGFDPEKIEISVEDGMLKLSGRIEEKKEEKERGYWCKEIRRGSFERMTRLPVSVKKDKITATYDNGVLKIVMPKSEPKPHSKINIKIKKG